MAGVIKDLIDLGVISDPGSEKVITSSGLSGNSSEETTDNDPDDLIEDIGNEEEYDVNFFLETLMNPIPRQEYDDGEGWSDYPVLNWEDGRTLIGGCGPLDDPYPCIEKYQYPYTNTKEVQENGLIREGSKFLSKTSSTVTGKSVQLRRGMSSYSTNKEVYGYPTNKKRKTSNINRTTFTQEGDVEQMYTRYYYNGVPIDVPEGHDIKKDDIIP